MLVTDDRRPTQERPEWNLGLSEAVLEFPPATSSVTEARHWASRTARAWSIEADVIEVLAFEVTELASNAVIHARSPFRVSLRFDGAVLRLEVEDASPELPREFRAAPEATAGRGFALVRALSHRTGVEGVRASGKRVWAELDT